jgi:hypothetical protein
MKRDLSDVALQTSDRNGDIDDDAADSETVPLAPKDLGV